MFALAWAQSGLTHRLDLGVVLQAVLSQLPAVPWSFISSKRSLSAKHVVAVDPVKQTTSIASLPVFPKTLQAFKLVLFLADFEYALLLDFGCL